MCTQYQPLNTLEEIVAAQKRGECIKVFVDGKWETWDGRWWRDFDKFRAVIQPKTKTITMCKILHKDTLGYFVTESEYNCQRDSKTFVKYIEGTQYTLEVPVE